jgi:hypothetical protein
MKAWDNTVLSEYWSNTSSATWTQTVNQQHKNEQEFPGKGPLASAIMSTEKTLK